MDACLVATQQMKRLALNDRFVEQHKHRQRQQQLQTATQQQGGAPHRPPRPEPAAAAPSGARLGPVIEMNQPRSVPYPYLQPHTAPSGARLGPVIELQSAAFCSLWAPPVLPHNAENRTRRRPRR